MKKVFATLSLALVATVVSASAAFADGITIRKVDTTAYPKVVINALVTSDKTPDAKDFALREDGKPISGLDVVPLSKTGAAQGVVLVIDVADSMKLSAKLDQAKAAAKDFVAHKPAGMQVAIVAFGSAARVMSDFTGDVVTLDKSIDDLQPAGDTAMWDAVSAAAGLFAEHSELQANLVLLADGHDNISTTKYDAAKNRVLGQHAVVFSVGLAGTDLDEGALKDLAASTGGRYTALTDAKQATATFADDQRLLQSQFQITYRSAGSGAVGIDLSAGGYHATANVNAGGVVQGTDANPTVIAPKKNLSFLTTPVGKLMVALLVLVAVGLLAYVVILLFVRNDTGLASVLSAYGHQEQTAADDDAAGGLALAQTPLIQRAVEATGRFATEQGYLPKIERMLEQADLPLRAAEALFFYLAGVVVLTVLGLVLTHSLLGAFFALIVVALVPMATVNFLAGRRRKKFTGQLPDMLQLLSGSLRAGYSLLQGVEAVAQEVEDPMGSELRRVLAEARLGRVLEEALEECAARMGSADFDWAVMAIRIQREVGGNLAELLQTVAETMIQRERLRREVKALTAEGRISAILLGVLPVGLGLVMYTVNPGYMRVLFHDSFGQFLVAGAAILAGVGFYWMYKTIQIEI